MGLYDRDYYRGHGSRGKSTVTKGRSIEGWLYIALLWILVLLALVKGARHFFPDEFNRFLHRKQGQPSGSVVEHRQAELQRVFREEPKAAGLSRDPGRYAPPPSYPTRSQPTEPSEVLGTTTIFHCKAYGGGTFWSSAHCNTQKALIDRTASVPAGMPFSQQVQLAEAQRKEAAALYKQAPSASVQLATRCSALKIERESIDARYSNWQWQPIEVINPDQRRMQAIRAEQARFGCPDR